MSEPTVFVAIGVGGTLLTREQEMRERLYIARRRRSLREVVWLWRAHNQAELVFRDAQRAAWGEGVTR